jgi:two-component system KDP operon response regulator KdpE
VLVVDDEPSVLQTLDVLLTSHGYRVRTAADGRAALHQIGERAPDVVMLDLGLPDIDGVEVCRRARQLTRNPIIVVTADDRDDRKVAALDVGADDYVTKPFSMPELLARLRVAERHRRLLATVADDQVMRCGALWVDTGAHQAGTGDDPLVLTPKEYGLLALLVRNSGRVLTHRTLLDQVWGPGGEMATLRTHMTQLRRKLAARGDAPEVLTEPGIGYRMVGGIEVSQPG